MFSPTLIMAMACLAMVPSVTSSVTPVLCSNSCNGTGMTVSATATINLCLSATATYGVWLLDLLNYLLVFIIGTLIVWLVAALVTLLGSLVIGLFNLLLTCICVYINIMIDYYSTPGASAATCRARCISWYNQYYNLFISYSGNLLLRPAILGCINVIGVMRTRCLQNVV